MGKKIAWPSIFLAITTGIYLLGIAIGYSMLSNEAFNLIPDPQTVQFSVIARHNIFIVFYMSLGILTFGIVTLLIIFLNGIGIGVLVSGLMGTQYIIGSLLSILPHAILEIPAFIIAATGDLYIVCAAILWFKHRDNKIKFIFRRGILFNIISLVMLILAAYIEAYLPVRLSFF